MSWGYRDLTKSFPGWRQGIGSVSIETFTEVPRMATSPIVNGYATAHREPRFVAEVHAVRACYEGRRQKHNGNNRQASNCRRRLVIHRHIAAWVGGSVGGLSSAVARRLLWAESRSCVQV